MTDDENKNPTNAITNIVRRVSEIEQQVLDIRWILSERRWKGIVHWIFIILIPILITVYGTFLVNKHGSAEVELHVVAKRKSDFSAVGSMYPASTDNTGVDTETDNLQTEYHITVINIGRVKATEAENRLSVQFNESIQKVYMGDGGDPIDLESESGPKDMETCIGQPTCKIGWPTVVGGGRVNLAFVFQEKSVKLEKLPSVSHGGKIAHKWTCCNLPSSQIQQQCDEGSSTDWSEWLDPVEWLQKEDDFCN